VFILSRVGVAIDGFGLVIGFIGHFNTQLVTTLYKSPSHKGYCSQSRSVLGSGFQRRTFHFLWVPELSPCLSYQLLQLSTACRHSLDKVKVMLRPTVSRPIYLGVKPYLGPQDQIFVTVRQLQVVDVGLPLWRTLE
jgi:hypothetical protein